MIEGYLKRVTIENFQSIKNAVLDLSPAITTITGKTDHGKSAMLRALRSLFFNQQGSGFITFGQVKSKVEGDFEGSSVVWEKGEKVNRYILTVDGVEKVFDKVGRNVPEEVIAFTQIRDIDFEEDKLRVNFADQFDPPFLLWESGIKASKILGSLTNLDMIYLALGNCSRDLKRDKASSKDLEERISGKKDQLVSYEGVDKENQFLKEIKVDLSELRTKTVKLASVSEINQGLQRLNKLKKDKQELLRDKKDRNIDLTEIKSKILRYQEITKLREEFERLNKSREISQERLGGRLSALQFKQEELKTLLATIKTCPLCKTILKK